MTGTRPAPPPAGASPTTGRTTPSSGTPDPGTSSGPPVSSVSPTALHLWKRSRALVAALLALVLFGLVYAVARSGENHGRLDPRSPDRLGSRAAAQLLAQRGVSVDLVTTAADAASRTGPDTTLLITVPDLLTPEQLTLIRDATSGSGGRLVLLAPAPSSLSVLAPQAQVSSASGVKSVRPGCELPAARRAGNADLGGILYDTTAPGADSCYRVAGHASLLRVPGGSGQGDTVLLGTPDPLYNHRLDQRGNASLALQLLGEHRNLVWYLPSPSDDSVMGEQRDFLDLVPDGWRWGALQLAVATAITALWRARRLGPVVPEPLPVTVRAAEATEGRARLYRTANARARAAGSLRQAARARLAPLVGVPASRAHDPDALTAAVSARGGVPSPDVRSLLYGAAPADDAALLRLADDLDALMASLHDWQVRTS